MRITTFYTKATRSIPVTVDYICEFCEHANKDDSQVIKVSGDSRQSLIRVYTDQMKQEAAENLETQTKRMLYDLNQKRYKKLGLTCTCSQCGKRQTWSSYRRSNDFFVTLFVLGLVFLVPSPFRILSMVGEEGAKALLLLAVPLLMIAPEAVILILNYRNKRRIGRMDSRYLPKITFKDPDMLQKEEGVISDENKAGAERDYISFFDQEHQDRARQPESGEWKCPSCWRMNKNSVTVCDCGSKKPEE